jgi:hypothetical protein
LRTTAFKAQATGETFNFQGKTDILIRVEAKNVYIAECKFWKGEKTLLATLDQLLSYLSWRDTKAALLAVRLVNLRVPVALPHSLDELRRDRVAFDRQRVIGVALVEFRR